VTRVLRCFATNLFLCFICWSSNLLSESALAQNGAENNSGNYSNVGDELDNFSLDGNNSSSFDANNSFNNEKSTNASPANNANSANNASTSNNSGNLGNNTEANSSNSNNMNNANSSNATLNGDTGSGISNKAFEDLEKSGELDTTAFSAPTESTESAVIVPSPVSPTVGTEAEKFDKDLRTYNSGVKQDLQRRLEADLRMYCLDYCSLLSFSVSSNEVFDAVTPDLGFENSARSTERSFLPERVTADVLVDVRYGEKNTERLKKLMQNITQTYSYPIEIIYTKIELPESDVTAKSSAEVRAQFVRRISQELEHVVRDFCPDECRVSDVQVQVEQASIDEINSGSLNRYIFARGSRGAVYVKGVNATLTVNSEMPAARRKRIENLFREVLQPMGEVNLSIRALSFPVSAAELEKDREQQRKDPYGLDKLREMLKIFKEFAGTKEIVRESSAERSSQTESSSSAVKTSRESNNSNTSASTLSSQSSKSESTALNSSTESSQQTGILGLSENTLYMIGGLLLVLFLIGIFGARYIMTGKRVQQVIGQGISAPPPSMASYAPSSMDFQGGPSPEPGTMGGGTNSMGAVTAAGGATLTPFTFAAASPPTQARGVPESSSQFARVLEIQRLKEELTQIFMRQPKVSREVFGRILREEGVPAAARCVSVFGEIVTFELLDDSELKDSLATLAEYVHRNVPQLQPEEELQLLESLKLRIAAGKIKVMSDKGLGSFDFLKSKSARQIYNLVADENSQSQSVVLTQLSKAKRNAVFELFEGESKLELLRALCQGRSVGYEYLMSLSDALRRKSQRSGAFDQGLTTGIDVLLDLLAQSSLADQQSLMSELDAANPESARMVRSSLVTPETLQFIRDGLLIEIFLGLDTATLATFLAGCPEHIRSMILSKVPPDMASDWFEMMNSMPSIDSENYKLAELQILQKVRSFSDSGMISLLEINESVFPPHSVAESSGARVQKRFKISQNVVA
jgi:flagellar motor switch protein FliG